MKLTLNKMNLLCLFSGFQLTYDLLRPKGDRVVEMLLRCSKCKVPRFFPMEPEKVYDVATVNYLIGGGDGLTMIKTSMTNHLQGRK